MLKRTQVLAAVLSIVAMLLMAVPAMAQTASPTATPTPTPEATATATPTQDETPTPTATSTEDQPEATDTVDSGTPTPNATSTEDNQGHQNEADSGRQGDVPPGQLTRRGLFGKVVAVGAGDIIVSTPFGNVTVQVNGSTKITMPPQGTVGLDSVKIGDRVAVLLDRSPVAPPSTSTVDATTTPTPTPTPDASETTDQTPTPTPTPDASGTTDQIPTPTPTPDATGITDETPTPTPALSFRTVTALFIQVIPSKATRTHQLTVVAGEGHGKVTVLNSNGQEVEMDATQNLSVGSDVVLLVKSQGAGHEDKVVGSLDPSEIQQRLQRFEQQAATHGNGNRSEFFQQLLQKRQQRESEHLQEMESHAPNTVKQRIHAGGNQGGQGSANGGHDGSPTQAGDGSQGQDNSGGHHGD